MARVNKKGSVTARVTSSSPVRSAPDASLRTHEGAAAFSRNVRGELFVLGVNLFDGEDTFYEKAADRKARWSGLCAQAAVEDPAWFAGFIGWLRRKGNIRTASIRGAISGVHARLADQASREADHKRSAEGDGKVVGWNRLILTAACARADEPGEMLAMWLVEYGRQMPNSLRRALSDLAESMYSERNLLSWDRNGDAVRFADVIELAHPKGRARWQGDLFRHAIDRRHGRDKERGVPESLEMVRRHAGLVSKAAGGDVSSLSDADELKAAGMKWETALSLGGKSADKKALWEAKIPTMGIFALTRNLRNFDEAGISREAQEQVIRRLTDPRSIAGSRMFPYRFLAAYRELSSLTWGPALETALSLSASNIPELPGKTLILVDTSSSMTTCMMSDKSKMSVADAAALFGTLLLKRNPGAELWGFANGVFRHQPRPGFSVLLEAQAFTRRTGEVGHGTEITQSLLRTYSGHDRAIIITDMQAFSDIGYGGSYYRASQTVTDVIPQDKFLYGFSLGGYKPSMMPSGTGTRHEMSGLTDNTFRLMSAVEHGENAAWPWEEGDDAADDE